MLMIWILIFVFSGTIGHVAHGKSTVVKAISGVQVIRCFHSVIHVTCNL